MEQWKIDIADNMISWDYARHLGVDYGIFVRCGSPDARTVCFSAIKTNIDKLCSDVKSVYTSGQTAIMVQVGSTQAEDQLKQNLNVLYDSVMNWRKSQAEKEAAEDPVEKKIERENNNALLIFLALVIVLIWII